jgi:hypothetical protein
MRKHSNRLINCGEEVEVNMRLVLSCLLQIIKFKSENPKERYHFERFVIGGSTILKLALKE